MFYLCTSLFTAMIIRPPENTTVCKDTNVTISCGYQSNAKLPVTWIIDGDFYNELALLGIGYRLNNISNPLSYSVTIRSIRYTTIVQCGICSPPKYSTSGRVTVVGTYLCSVYVCMYVHCTYM